VAGGMTKDCRSVGAAGLLLPLSRWNWEETGKRTAGLPLCSAWGRRERLWGRPPMSGGGGVPLLLSSVGSAGGDLWGLGGCGCSVLVVDGEGIDRVCKLLGLQ
jgi:hypothetical protein